jgi:alpha-galactosidase/6-phospho-beta-glucosidase family protein
MKLLMLTTKIIAIGASSTSYSLNTLGVLMCSRKLGGSELTLVDMNTDTLVNVKCLAEL